MGDLLDFKNKLQKCGMWSEFADGKSAVHKSASLSKLVGFTLAEGATHVAICNDRRKIAFTLAEVLITLGVVGIVAAMTMPVLIANINDRVNFERHANIAYKMTQAMEQMRAHDKLVQYESTEKFVDELQKYLKITKRCSASNIAECWPTETVIDAEGSEYTVANAKKRTNILANTSEGNIYDDNVGLILADGASIILTYNKDAEPIDIGEKVTAVTIKNTKGQDIAYSIAPTTSSIDFLTDVNGKKGPNTEGKDIKSFSVASFARHHACDNGSQGCLYLVPTYTRINCCMTNDNMQTEEYQKYCGSGNPDTQDCLRDAWAGARKACDEAGMILPNESKLISIRTVKNSYTGSLAPLNSNLDHWYFWSSDYYSGTRDAKNVDFSANITHQARRVGGYHALCINQ